jgi:hypothetical protein
MVIKETQTENSGECLEAAKFIIERRGVPDQQKGTRVYTDGDLRFERTNTGDIEVKVRGKLALSEPLVRSPSHPRIWQPGDWVRQVYEIRSRIHS